LYVYICDMKKKLTDETTFVIRMDEETKQKLKAKAKESSRSINGHILHLIKSDLKDEEINQQGKSRFQARLDEYMAAQNSKLKK